MKARILMLTGCRSLMTVGTVFSVPSSLIQDLSRRLEDAVLSCGIDEFPGLSTLVEALAGVPDPRAMRGRRFGLPFLVATAVLAGTKSIAALARWFVTVDQQALAAIGGAPVCRR